jgi:hypothetical protein
MELPLSTFTSRLSTPALQLIGRPFNHRPIGEERLDDPLDLLSQTKKTLSKPTDLLPVSFLLYAHYLITYRLRNKSQEKNEVLQKIFLRKRKENPGAVRIAVYSGLTADHPNSVSVEFATV